MNELNVPDMAIGALALAAALLYAAWHEYAASNRRDARLLAGMRTASVMGGAIAWLQ